MKRVIKQMSDKRTGDSDRRRTYHRWRPAPRLATRCSARRADDDGRSLLAMTEVVNGFVNETRRNGGDGGETRRDGWDGRLIVACAVETWEATGDGDRLAHNAEVADPYLVLATSGNASGGLRPWRLSCRS